MTKPPPQSRKPVQAFLYRHGPELGMLLLASLVRLDGIAFGLPALNDPDEPLFMLIAFDMLQRGSPDPQWFGHPGTITLYCLAIIMAAVAGLGIAIGHYPGIEAFAQAVHVDPGIVILPARLFIAANGVACVWLTYSIGRQLWGRGAGLAAGGLLSINALHVTWSQVVRTDVQASVFMLLCVLSAIALYRRMSLRGIVVAGIFAGLACATKWPAALVILSPLAVILRRHWQDGSGVRRAALLVAVAGATLLAVSPFLLISADVALANLSAEGRPRHPGATGAGFLGNLVWYTTVPLAHSFGWGALLAAIAGTGAAAFRSGVFRLTIIPVLATSIVLLCAQHLVWERWLVPILPFLMLGLGWILSRVFRAGFCRHTVLRVITGLAVVGMVLPMVQSDRARLAERRNDTRQLATRWTMQHAMPGATIMVEHAALDLLTGRWKVIFPLGSAGCMDAQSALSGKTTFTQIEERRKSSPIVDLGHIRPETIATCRADFYILANYRRYEAEQAVYGEEFGRYRQLIGHARLLEEIAPVPGQTGGPHILIFGAASTGSE